MTLRERWRAWWTPTPPPISHPDDVHQGSDGGFYREALTTEGVVALFRVCEDCWQYLPRYVDFPRGLVSPESDGDGSWNRAKTRPVNILDGTMGLEHLQKIVCLPCYRAAFARVYPGADLPELRSALMAEQQILAPTESQPLSAKSWIGDVH